MARRSTSLPILSDGPLPMGPLPRRGGACRRACGTGDSLHGAHGRRPRHLAITGTVATTTVPIDRAATTGGEVTERITGLRTGPDA